MAIAFVQGSYGTTATSGTTCSHSLTIGSGSNRCIAICAQADNDDKTVSTLNITSGGAGGNVPVFVGRRTNGGRTTEWWYLKAPAVSAAITLEATWSATIVGAAVLGLQEWTDVDQTTVVNGFTSGGSVNTLDVTSTAADATVFGIICNTTVSFTSGTSVAIESSFNIAMARGPGAATSTFTVSAGGRGCAGMNLIGAAASGIVGPLIEGRLVGGVLVKGRLVG